MSDVINRACASTFGQKTQSARLKSPPQVPIQPARPREDDQPPSNERAAWSAGQAETARSIASAFRPRKQMAKRRLIGLPVVQPLIRKAARSRRPTRRPAAPPPVSRAAGCGDTAETCPFASKSRPPADARLRRSSGFPGAGSGQPGRSGAQQPGDRQANPDPNARAATPASVPAAPRPRRRHGTPGHRQRPFAIAACRFPFRHPPSVHLPPPAC